MMQYSVKDLFQVQADLVDTKVDMVVSKSIDRVIERIESLRAEVHEITERLTAVETKLGMRDAIQSEIRNRTIEYVYKAGWLVLVAVISAVVSATFLYFHVNA